MEEKERKVRKPACASRKDSNDSFSFGRKQTLRWQEEGGEQGVLTVDQEANVLWDFPVDRMSSPS